MTVASELRRKLIWLVSARLGVSTLLLGLAVALQITAPDTRRADPYFFLIGLTYALTVAYVVSLSHVERHRWLIDVQFACDAVTVTAFVWLTGGVTSYYTLLYVLPIIGASMLQFRSGGLRIAVLSAVLFGGLVVEQYGGGPGYVNGRWEPALDSLLPPVRVAAYTAATNAVAFAVVALLSGSLAERLRRADDRLARASSALADLQAFNQDIIDSLTSGLATTDYSGRVLTFNRAAEAICGVPAAAVVGRPVAGVLQLPEPFAELLARDLDGAASSRADYVYRHGDGRAVDLGVSATHLLTPDGRAGLLLTFQDTTEIRRLEREGRRRQRLAAVGEMAAGIAHEIRNPLASMRGSIQVLRQELTLNDEQALLMDIVLRESDRLNETIRSFLTYARPQRAAAARFDAARVLQETAILLRNGSDVRDDHAIEVDAGDEPIWFEADESQIRQIVWNLASNGLRAMPDGGRLRLAARAVTSADGRLLVLEVADEGVGIPPAQLDHLFHPFSGSFPRGSGLGLAIVHRIVSDYGGEVQVQSREGAGTAVSVVLPLDRGAADGRASDHAPSPPSDAAEPAGVVAAR